MPQGETVNATAPLESKAIRRSLHRLRLFGSNKCGRASALYLGCGLANRLAKLLKIERFAHYQVHRERKVAR